MEISCCDRYNYYVNFVDNIPVVNASSLLFTVVFCHILFRIVSHITHLYSKCKNMYVCSLLCVSCDIKIWTGT